MLLLAFVLTFVINIVPFFMPPTWTLLAFFRVRFDLPTLLLAPFVPVLENARIRLPAPNDPLSSRPR